MPFPGFPTAEFPRQHTRNTGSTPCGAAIKAFGRRLKVPAISPALFPPPCLSQHAGRTPQPGASGGEDSCGGGSGEGPSDDPGMEEALLASKLDNIVRCA